MLNNKSKYPLDLNKQSLKHGYPLHMAILSQKFDIALYLLKMDVDPHVLNTIGANLIHLLFVKYDKDLSLALQILK
jgi:ankyrin repeat protein